MILFDTDIEISGGKMGNLRFCTLIALIAGLLAFQAHAGVSINNGQVTINASGGDGGYGGGDGGNAGDVNLNLSYADAAKTQVKLDGTMVIGGRSQPISEVLPVSTLKSIRVIAVGGDGGSGYAGSDGHDGYDGSNGYEGCPPGNGSNGGNGTDGGDGGAGGDGGRGGVIHVGVSGDQSEILMLVSTETAPGRGGAGGSGGRGGRAGSGGYGGRSNCVDSKGNPVPGPDGQRGSDGYPGRDGSNGVSGRGGRPGSQSYDVVDNGVTHSYPRPFHLSLQGLKTLDDNEDGILEPGENLHVMQLQVANSGPMPTPTGQAIKLALQASPSLVIKKLPALVLNQALAGNSVQTLNFQKGDAVLQGVNNAKLIGTKAVFGSTLSINFFSHAENLESGYIFHWPVGVSADVASVRQYFGSAQYIPFTLNNVSNKDVGPTTSQPAETVFSWASNGVPGSDVTVTLKDGRHFDLSQPYQIGDFVLPAKSKTPLPLSLTIANSKKVLTGSGKLKVVVKLKNFASSTQDQVDVAQTTVLLAIDLRPVAVNRHLDFTRSTSCIFPDSDTNSNQEADVSALDLVKAKGSAQITAYFYKWGQKSPAFVLPAFDFAPYTDLLSSSDEKLVLSFLNDMLAAATKKSDSYWRFSGCYAK